MCIYRIESLKRQYAVTKQALEDKSRMDENFNNKFDSISKELQGLKVMSKYDSLSKQHKDLTVTVTNLESKIAQLSEELELANKRADQSDDRYEKLLNEFEEQARVNSNKDVNYQLTISKLKARCIELKELNSEQKSVAEGIYKELNKTLVLCSSLEKERSDLKLQLEMMKGGEVNIRKLKDALADEQRRVKSQEEANQVLKEEIAQGQVQIHKLMEKNGRLKEMVEEISVHLREKASDAKKYLLQLDEVAADKRNIMNSLVHLRQNYIKVSDKLVDMQGNIR